MSRNREDMLGRIVELLDKIPAKWLGMLVDLLGKLCGKEKKEWATALGHFLRKENSWKGKGDATFTLSTVNASMPEEWRENGWTVASHRPLAKGEVTVTFCDGEMYIDGVRVIEYLSPEQERGGRISGEALEKHLETMPALPDTLLDLLIREQDNEEVAKFLARFEDHFPFFWGTPYEAPGGRRYVRYLYRLFGRWYWSDRWLVRVWDRSHPALVLAHPLEA